MKTKPAKLRMGALILIGALLISGMHMWTRMQSINSTRYRGIRFVGPSYRTIRTANLGEVARLSTSGPIVLYDVAPDTHIQWK